MRQIELDNFTTTQGQITDRFTKAIDQLGSVDASGKPKLEIRLGVSRETLRKIIGQVLTAYVRENSPLKVQENKKRFSGIVSPNADIQAILTVLGRRERTYERTDQRLNLDEAMLHSLGVVFES
jgi:hypothetical protein